jgi:hypothetical protein
LGFQRISETGGEIIIVLNKQPESHHHWQRFPELLRFPPETSPTIFHYPV